MRKTQQEITVYKFNELCESSKQIAICRVCEDKNINYLEDDFTPEFIEAKGYEFYCDGDIYPDQTI